MRWDSRKICTDAESHHIKSPFGASGEWNGPRYRHTALSEMSQPTRASDVRWGDCRDHTILSSFIKLMITQQIRGRRKIFVPTRRHLSCVLWWDPLHEESDLNEWIIGIVTLPANILQTSPHTTHSGLRHGKHSDRRISNRDVCRHESDQRWIKHFNFRFYGWLQILSLLKDEDIYNI